MIGSWAALWGSKAICQHIKEPLNGMYCLNFFKKWPNSKVESLFHIKSNLVCQLVRVLFALQCIFLCVRTWWEQRGLSEIATVTEEGGSLRTVNWLNLIDKKFPHTDSAMGSNQVPSFDQQVTFVWAVASYIASLLIMDIGHYVCEISLKISSFSRY